MIKLQGKSQIITKDEELTLYRTATVIYNQGRAVPGSEESHSFRCNVQPVNGKDLLLVPEGDRFKEQYWIYTSPEENIRVNDRVVRLEINFQVQSVETWGSFARARIMRVDVGNQATR